MLRRKTAGARAVLALLLAAALAALMCACSSNGSGEPEQPSQAVSQEPAAASSESGGVAADFEEKLKKTDYGGVVYVEINGEPFYTYADGALENGSAITAETPMPVGSVSKQFCAAAVMLLSEQGKLGVEDTLDKYFPEYGGASAITVRDLLSMRSGLPELKQSVASNDVPYEENSAAVREFIFSQTDTEEPDTRFEYRNSNYFLLADIVEQVSGKRYCEFLRESFLDPLRMTHTGTLDELPDSPQWAQGNVYKELDCAPGLTKGAGDVVSNAADMTIWLNALQNGDIISKESVGAMTTDHSSGEGYGYGLRPYAGGWAHSGENGIYTAFDFFEPDKHITIFMASNTESSTKMSSLFMELAGALTQKQP